MTKNRELYALVALGLLVLHLGLFAVISPYFAHAADDWNYLLLGERLVERQDLFWNWQNRQFLTWEMGLAHLLFPRRYEGLLYFHLAFLYLGSLLFFHVLKICLPRSAWFAFICAAIYLLYVPFNQHYFLNLMLVSSWVLLLLLTSLASYLEFLARVGQLRWLFWGMSIITGFMSVRAYESAIPLAIFIPLITFYQHKETIQASFLRWRLSSLTSSDKKWLVVFGGAALIWWFAVGLGIVQSAYPYLTGSEAASYQASKADAEDLSTGRLQDEWWLFLQNTFPLDRLESPHNYFLPAILASFLFGIVTLLFKRRFPDQFNLPPPLHLAFGAAFGLILIHLGGVVFMVAQLSYAWRAQMFATAGVAILLACLSGLVAWLGQRLCQVPHRLTMVCLNLGLVLAGMHWFYGGAVHWSTTAQFTDKTYFWEQVLAMMPRLEDDTFIQLQLCDYGTNETYLGTSLYLKNSASYAYIYQTEAGTGVGMDRLGQHAFDEQGMFFDQIFKEVSYQQHYGYDQMIVLECEADYITLMERFPADQFGPAGADFESYNPYARIRLDYIPSELSPLLAP